MFKNWTYQEVKEKANAIKDIGYKEIYLDTPPYPWEHVVTCERGGSHRLNIATSVWFRAVDPESGISLRWSFDIEPRSANGRGTYYIDVDGCHDVLDKLTGLARNQFQEYLLSCAKEVEKQANELQQEASRERKVAGDLKKAGQG